MINLFTSELYSKTTHRQDGISFICDTISRVSQTQKILVFRLYASVDRANNMNHQKANDFFLIFIYKVKIVYSDKNR
jgi:hypothetical protein